MASALSPAGLLRLHEVMAGYVERQEVPAIVSLVSRRGEIHTDAIGCPRDSIFRIPSMSKQVTAVAAMILAEDGIVRLDEPSMAP